MFFDPLVDSKFFLMIFTSMIYFPNESLRMNEKRSAHLEIATESRNHFQIF